VSDDVEKPARSEADAEMAIRNNPPLIMSLSECAVFLGISYRKIREDIQARRIPHVRLGGKILIRRDALMAALEKLEIQSV
jgi:excisionase family DNA binding protein